MTITVDVVGVLAVLVAAIGLIVAIGVHAARISRWTGEIHQLTLNLGASVTGHTAELMDVRRTQGDHGEQLAALRALTGYDRRRGEERGG